MEGKNRLYFGDNLKILREYVPDASVDLIYLDPPFNSSATDNVLFRDVAQGPLSGPAALLAFPAAQIAAFEAVAPTGSCPAVAGIGNFYKKKEPAITDCRYSGS
jgi:DNA modification methylase